MSEPGEPPREHHEKDGKRHAVSTYQGNRSPIEDMCIRFSNNSCTVHLVKLK
jgi:hypothetical protein